ncbi:uncharacterized protein LOC130357929 isoform X2 [Hyla sarda]|uniref:uncharacterized protein LOC130357929 isoform X2 n=1 Tax=Hyla sarda TaxID=327740 RepID=UPI0024C32E4C|nr:uncharacterized protein LOC130357929 isoform X2 [Hyla sarda]XP_056416660.1 uncharacterized protein LOC130357929 isoform X2 [Hyla sarda]
MSSSESDTDTSTHLIAPSSQVTTPALLTDDTKKEKDIEETMTQNLSTSEDTGSSRSKTSRKRTQKNPATEKTSSKKSKKTKDIAYQVDPSAFLTEDVIHYVQERPCLWDKSHPKHHDNICTRRRWEEIYLKLFPDFLRYNDSLQEAIAIRIEKSWRSVRDSFFKWLRDSNLPSGSAAKQTTYKHAERLSFLQMRATISNIAATTTSPQRENINLEEEEPAEEEAGPSHTQASGHQSTVSSGLRATLSHKHKSKKFNVSKLVKCVLDAIEKLENMCSSKFLHLDVRVMRLEGMISGPTPSPCRDFLMTLIPSMERMSEEQQALYKQKIIKFTHDFLNPTPAQPASMYPPPSPSFQTQRPRTYMPPFPQRYDETFEGEEGQVYPRI